MYNKIRVICFCPNCVNFFPKNVQFFYFLRGRLPHPPPLCSPARAPMPESFLTFSGCIEMEHWVKIG